MFNAHVYNTGTDLSTKCPEKSSTLTFPQIRLYPVDARGKISDVKSAAWPATFSQARSHRNCTTLACTACNSSAALLLQYLTDLECPLEHNSRSACRGEALDWLLRHAVSLEHADSCCASDDAGAASAVELCSHEHVKAQFDFLLQWNCCLLLVEVLVVHRNELLRLCKGKRSASHAPARHSAWLAGAHGASWCGREGAAAEHSLP